MSMNDVLIYEDNKWCYRYQLEDPVIYGHILERVGISKHIQIIPEGSQGYDKFFSDVMKQYENKYIQD